MGWSKHDKLSRQYHDVTNISVTNVGQETSLYKSGNMRPIISTFFKCQKWKFRYCWKDSGLLYKVVPYQTSDQFFFLESRGLTPLKWHPKKNSLDPWRWCHMTDQDDRLLLILVPKHFFLSSMLQDLSESFSFQNCFFSHHKKSIFLIKYNIKLLLLNTDYAI